MNVIIEKRQRHVLWWTMLFVLGLATKIHLHSTMSLSLLQDIIVSVPHNVTMVHCREQGDQSWR